MLGKISFSLKHVDEFGSRFAHNSTTYGILYWTALFVSSSAAIIDRVARLVGHVVPGLHYPPSEHEISSAFLRILAMAGANIWVREWRPLLSLSLIFIIWKSFILSIAFLSPGTGYDTSTSLLESTYNDEHYRDEKLPTTLTLSRKLVRWDALYYIHLASEGHVFEQEWAFGTGLSTVLSSLTHSILGPRTPEIDDYVFTGIVVSHVAHWLSVILVWLIAFRCTKASSVYRSSVSFVAAVMHIVSPAGIFLSVPYSESLFACLNLLGFYLYTMDTADASLYRVCAGMVFGCATMIRSNGLFSGLPFLLDALIYTRALANWYGGVQYMRRTVLSLCFTVLGGICIAIGMFVPQCIAYNQYCTGVENNRPWCTAMPPSIYTFVQSHYWNVGFLNYWTLSNLPLFFLATPVLCLMIRSSWESCFTSTERLSSNRLQNSFSIRLALPQLALAVLALTNFHVQIITRLASAYPLWHIWLATNMHKPMYYKYVVPVMLVYGVVQAALYASFLPPA